MMLGDASDDAASYWQDFCAAAVRNSRDTLFLVRGTQQYH
jgi:hypothetical protein